MEAVRCQIAFEHGGGVFNAPASVSANFRKLCLEFGRHHGRFGEPEARRAAAGHGQGEDGLAVFADSSRCKTLWCRGERGVQHRKVEADSTVGLRHAPTLAFHRNRLFGDVGPERLRVQSARKRHQEEDG